MTKKHIKLYKVHIQNQNPEFSAEHEDVTVHAPNIKSAIDTALKLTWVSKATINSVEDVELLGVSQN